jgi:hypothetical protein
MYTVIIYTRDYNGRHFKEETIQQLNYNEVLLILAEYKDMNCFITRNGKVFEIDYTMNKWDHLYN